MEPRIRVLDDAEETGEGDDVQPASEPLLDSLPNNLDNTLPHHVIRENTLSKERLLLYAGPALLLW